MVDKFLHECFALGVPEKIELVPAGFGALSRLLQNATTVSMALRRRGEWLERRSHKVAFAGETVVARVLAQGFVLAKSVRLLVPFYFR